MFDLEERIGYRFRDRHLLEEALTHASLLVHGDEERSYQRLEFLGDSVLNLSVAEELYRLLPEAGEGELSRARHAAINNRNLVRVGERMGVSEALRTDPSIRMKGGGVTRKMVADAVEAIVGAVFLDGGYDKARELVLARFGVEERLPELVSRFDAKSRLQEWCHRHRIPVPEYRLLSTTGAPHDRTFQVTVRVDGRAGATGTGFTKKEAEMEAAARLLPALESEEDGA